MQRIWMRMAASGCLAVATLAAQNVPTTLYGGMEWRNVGPFRGGRSVTAVGVASNPRLYYFGSVGGGVWKTENAGESWTNITDGQLKTSSVGALAVSSSDPNVIYAGMGEHDARGVAISFGDGVYKSTDAGRTWKHIGLDQTRAISRVLIHPTSPDVVYVAAQGATFGATKDRGVFRSTDGGSTWKNVLFVNETTGPADLAMDPANPRILYAAMWDHLRKPWEVRSGGPGSGIYKSTDGGDTWNKINEGLPALIGKIGISVSPNPERLYAIVEADPKGGVYRSDNGGKNWTLLNDTDWALKSRSWYYMKIFADPRNADVVWVLNADVSRSIDGGKTFTKVNVPHGDNHDLWINPHDSNTMIEANDGGAIISFNGGRSWSSEDNQPTAQIYRVNSDNRFPYWMYGGQQDNTSVGIASRANGAGITLRDWYPVGGCESAYVAFNKDNPEHVYAGCYHGMITEFNSSTHDERDVAEYPMMGLAQPSRELKYRFNWHAPIVVSQHDPKVIYHASQILTRSEDGGNTWTEISPDLTKPDDKTQGFGGGPITNEGAGGEVYNTIYYVAESPQDKNTLWAGTDDGLLQLTRDGGHTWKKMTLASAADAQINAIEVSPHAPGTVYVAATRYKWNDMAPYIFKSTDYGQTWTKLVDGIPADSWAHVVREDPVRKDLLYAGTENGVFVSFNGGRQWQSLQLNLPVTPVNDLQVHPSGDLLAATGGRAFWVLDDVAPLRQAQANFATETVHLFEPRVAYRTDLGGTGEPGRTPEGPIGKNPPGGAIIDFFLIKEGPAKIEVRDGAGKLVRTYTTEKREGETNPTLKVKTGMNRVTWDLHYESPTRVPGAFLFRGVRGRLAMPGTYEIRLIAGPDTKTTKVEVKQDPRLHTTVAQMQEQETFLATLDGELDDLQKSVLRLRQVRAQLEDVVKRLKESGGNAGVETAAKALIDKLNAQEDALIQKRTVDGQTVINFPVKLAHHLSYLHGSVDDADAGVTEGAKKRAADLARQWNEHKAELASLLGPQLDAVNQQIAASHMPYVTVPK